MEKIIFKWVLLAFFCMSNYYIFAQKVSQQNKVITYNLPPKVDSVIDFWITAKLHSLRSKNQFRFMVFIEKISFYDSLDNKVDGYCLYLYKDSREVLNNFPSIDDVIYRNSHRIIVTKLNRYKIPVFFNGFDDVFFRQKYIFDSIDNTWGYTEFTGLKHHGLNICFDIFNRIYSCVDEY